MGKAWREIQNMEYYAGIGIKSGLYEEEILMRNFKVYDLCINGNIASGIVKGLIYRVTFDFTPTEKEAKRAIREAAAWNN